MTPTPEPSSLPWTVARVGRGWGVFSDGTLVGRFAREVDAATSAQAVNAHGAMFYAVTDVLACASADGPAGTRARFVSDARWRALRLALKLAGA